MRVRICVWVRVRENERPQERKKAKREKVKKENRERERDEAASCPERVCVEVSSDLLVGLIIVLVGYAGGIVIGNVTLHVHAIHGHTLRIAVAICSVHLWGNKHKTPVRDSDGIQGVHESIVGNVVLEKATRGNSPSPA